MKKLLGLFSFIVLFVYAVNPAKAAIIAPENESDSKSKIVSQDQVIDDDLFIAGDTVIIEGTINGDLFAAGGTVLINGTVNGDIYAAGGTLEVSGTVAQDVILAGGNISVNNASIGDGLILAGGNIIVDDQSSIGGGLVFAGGTITSNVNVPRGTTGGGGQVTINGSVGKNVNVGAGVLTLGPNAQVAGDLVYTSEQEPTFAPGASVSGNTQKIEPAVTQFSQDFDSQKMKEAGDKFFTGARLGFTIWSYLAALIVGAIALRLFPKPSQEVSKTLTTSFAPSLGWGFVSFLLAGPIFIVLMITGVGIPVALIALSLFIIDLYLAKLVFGLALGNWLKTQFGWKTSPFVTYSLGLALYYLVKYPLILSFFARAIATLSGLGGLFIYTKKALKRAQK